MLELEGVFSNSVIEWHSSIEISRVWIFKTMIILLDGIMIKTKYDKKEIFVNLRELIEFRPHCFNSIWQALTRQTTDCAFILLLRKRRR